MIQMNANGHIGCHGMRYHLWADDLDGHNGIRRLRMVYNYGDVNSSAAAMTPRMVSTVGVLMQPRA